MSESLRQKLNLRLEALKQERSSWDPAIWDICEQLLPYRCVRDGKGDRNRGEKREGKIINGTPARAVARAVAGIQSGITNPAVDWFGVTVRNKERAELPSVRAYLHGVFEALKASIAMSNWYRALTSATYPDVLVPGTAAGLHEEPTPGRARFRFFPWGTYWIDVSADDIVDTLIHEDWPTTRQIVQSLGEAALPAQIRESYKQGKMNATWQVFQCVMPNEDYEQGRIGAEGFEWGSFWWAGCDTSDNILRRGGYRENPILAPRWTSRDGDAYGHGPGWETRGDCRELQHHEKRAMQLLDKTVDPPKQGPAGIKRASLLPGDYTAVPQGTAGRIESMVDINPAAIPATSDRIDKLEYRVRDAYFNDLLRTLLDDDRAQRATAAEIDATTREAMMQFGPVLQKFDGELFKPMIERQLGILERTGQLPEPPREVWGEELEIEFISILHQAQRSRTLQGVRTLVQETSALAVIRPDAVDKLDVDAIVDEVARVAGTRPDLVMSRDAVDKMRGEKAKIEQGQQVGQSMLGITEGIRNVAGADPKNLQALASMVAPAAAAMGPGR